MLFKLQVLLGLNIQCVQFVYENENSHVDIVGAHTG